MSTTTLHERQLSVDLARGMAVIFMIAVHTLTVYGDTGVQNSIPGSIIGFLGGPPAAPVFMTLMGFSYVYARQTDLRQKLKRALKIFLMGYLLNFIRGVLPFEFARILNFDIMSSVQLKELNAFILFTMADILQFAGIALIIMAFIQKFKFNKIVIFLSLVLVTCISPDLWGRTSGNLFLDFILEPLWGNIPIPFIENKIAFPVFPWLAFPLLGMILGDMVKNSSNSNKTYNLIGLTGAIVFIVAAIFISEKMEYHFNDYYHSRPGAIIFMLGFVMLWLYICKLLVDFIPNNPIFTLLFEFSKGVTNIYIIHWTIICWGIGLFGIADSALVTVFFQIIVITVISYFLNRFISVKAKKTTS